MTHLISKYFCDFENLSIKTNSLSLKFHFQYNMTFRLDVRWVTGELRYPHSKPDTTALLPLVSWS